MRDMKHYGTRRKKKPGALNPKGYVVLLGMVLLTLVLSAFAYRAYRQAPPVSPDKATTDPRVNYRGWDTVIHYKAKNVVEAGL